MLRTHVLRIRCSCMLSMLRKFERGKMIIIQPETINIAYLKRADTDKAMEAHRHRQSHGSEGISQMDCKKHPRSKPNQVLLYTVGPTGPTLNGTWYMSINFIFFIT